MGHLTRNIKIISGPDTAFGFSIYVHRHKHVFNRYESRWFHGSLVLRGVELRNGGQYGSSTKSALQFVNLQSNSNVSSVQGSSFVNCHSECINVRYSHNISITNNVIFKARTFGMEV